MVFNEERSIRSDLKSIEYKLDSLESTIQTDLITNLENQGSSEDSLEIAEKIVRNDERIINEQFVKILNESRNIKEPLYKSVIEQPSNVSDALILNAQPKMNR